jgi:hypothetical protein
VLSREPLLTDQPARAVAPMRPRTVLQVIPGYHPIYQDAPAELLAMVDDRYAHGCFREWARFTHSALAFCREQNAKRVDRAGRAGGARAARRRSNGCTISVME